METVKFLQISGLTGQGGWEPWIPQLPPGKRAVLHGEQLEPLRRAVNLAREERVDAVLCAGGLWDDTTVTDDQARKVYDLLGSLSPLPVLVAPGPLDPLHPFSFHWPEFFQRSLGTPHPANVLVFGTGGELWESRIVPALPRVEFRGRAVTLRRGSAQPVAEERSSADTTIRIGIAPAPVGEENTSSFEQGTAAPLDWIALGSEWPKEGVVGGTDRIRWACPEHEPLNNSSHEAPARHYVLIGEVQKGGVQAGSLKRIPVDSRRVVQVSVALDPSVGTVDEVRDRIEKAASDAGTAPEDLVFGVLHGRVAPDLLAGLQDVGPVETSPRWFHLILDQCALEVMPAAEAAVLAESKGPEKLRARFLRRLTHRINGDLPSSGAAGGALAAGFRALESGRVEDRYVD